MPVPSNRVSERLAADFGTSAPPMLSTLERLKVAPEVDPERIHAAIVIAARGDRSLFDDALEHARVDWRDLLDRTDLADDDWRRAVDDALGEESPA